LTATQHSSVAEKEKFINDLADFVKSGFTPRLFTKELYNRLSMCFGHMAHYNKSGFFAEWFEMPHEQLAWIKRNQAYKPCGDSKYTYSDAEDIFVQWLNGPEVSKIVIELEDKCNQEVIAAAYATIQRAEAILAKHGQPLRR